MVSPVFSCMHKPLLRPRIACIRGEANSLLRRGEKGELRVQRSRAHSYARPGISAVELNGAKLATSSIDFSFDTSEDRVLTTFSFPEALCVGDVELAGASYIVQLYKSQT
jgi:hypothetical protein